jgi:hypothetical protein
MKERLNCLLSEVGESINYMRSDIRNLSRYLAELEELIEGYRTFAANATLNTQTDRATRRKLLKKTQKVIRLPAEKQPEPGAHRGKPAQTASRGLSPDNLVTSICW